MIAKLLILLFLIQTNAEEEAKDQELQKLTAEIVRLRLENLRLTDEMTRLWQQNKSQNSKIDILLKVICNRAYKCTDQKIASPPLPSSCDEALDSDDPSGVYKLSTHASDLMGLKPFDAYCLNLDERWTIVQRRYYYGTSVSFNRGWEDYRRGFGNTSESYFIGLDNLHALTTKPQQLWIQLETFNGTTIYAKYDSFSVGSKYTKYSLQIVGEYTGNAGDYLKGLEGVKFSTRDKNNDKIEGENCAELKMGGWWYSGCPNGVASNLNGIYSHVKPIQGITWNGTQLIRYSHMAIRPME